MIITAFGENAGDLIAVMVASTSPKAAAITDALGHTWTLAENKRVWCWERWHGWLPIPRRRWLQTFTTIR